VLGVWVPCDSVGCHAVPFMVDKRRLLKRLENLIMGKASRISIKKHVQVSCVLCAHCNRDHVLQWKYRVHAERNIEEGS
jgi:hypothetical protein